MPDSICRRVRHFDGVITEEVPTRMSFRRVAFNTPQVLATSASLQFPDRENR